MNNNDTKVFLLLMKQIYREIQQDCLSYLNNFSVKDEVIEQFVFNESFNIIVKNILSISFFGKVIRIVYKNRESFNISINIDYSDNSYFLKEHGKDRIIENIFDEYIKSHIEIFIRNKQILRTIEDL